MEELELEFLLEYGREKARLHKKTPPKLKKDPLKKPQTNAERMRRYRERLKAKDPEGFYEKERQRSRIQARKKRATMTEEEKDELRRRDRERRQRQRYRKRLLQQQNPKEQQTCVGAENELGSAALKRRLSGVDDIVENKYVDVVNYEDIECKLEIEDDNFEECSERVDDRSVEELIQQKPHFNEDHHCKIEIEILPSEYNFESLENVTPFEHDCSFEENETQMALEPPQPLKKTQRKGQRVKFLGKPEDILPSPQEIYAKLQREKMLRSERMRRYRARLKAINQNYSQLKDSNSNNNELSEYELMMCERLANYRRKAAERCKRYRARKKEKERLLSGKDDGSSSPVKVDLKKAKKAEYSRAYRAMIKREKLNAADPESLLKFEQMRRRTTERVRKHRDKQKAADAEKERQARERQCMAEPTIRKKQILTDAEYLEKLLQIRQKANERKRKYRAKLKAAETAGYSATDEERPAKQQCKTTTPVMRQQRQAKKFQRNEITTRAKDGGNFKNFEETEIYTCFNNEDEWQRMDVPIVEYECVDPLNILEVNCFQ